MAKLTLGLRKLGYEDLDSIAVLDKQNATNTSTSTRSGSGGGDGGVEIGDGSSSGGGGGHGGVDNDGSSVTRIVARRLLRDMRATSERYVVVASSSAASAGKAVAGASHGGGGSSSSERGSVERSKRAEHSSIRGRAGGRGGAGVALEDERGGAGGGGGLTFAGFMAWSSVHGGRLMLVKDLVYACLAEFGMRPAKAVQEREVIQEIFRRCAFVAGRGRRGGRAVADDDILSWSLVLVLLLLCGVLRSPMWEAVRSWSGLVLVEKTPCRGVGGCVFAAARQPTRPPGKASFLPLSILDSTTRNGTRTKDEALNKRSCISPFPLVWHGLEENSEPDRAAVQYSHPAYPVHNARFVCCLLSSLSTSSSPYLLLLATCRPGFRLV